MRERSEHSVRMSREASNRSKLEKRARIQSIKETAQCADCPITQWWPGCALQFDHLGEDEKHRNVGNMMSRSWAAISAEIAKCEVVCASHHAIRTERRRLAAVEKAARVNSSS